MFNINKNLKLLLLISFIQSSSHGEDVINTIEKTETENNMIEGNIPNKNNNKDNFFNTLISVIVVLLTTGSCYFVYKNYNSLQNMNYVFKNNNSLLGEIHMGLNNQKDNLSLIRDRMDTMEVQNQK